jgi:hypothetical protein
MKPSESTIESVTRTRIDLHMIGALNQTWSLSVTLVQASSITTAARAELAIAALRATTNAPAHAAVPRATPWALGRGQRFGAFPSQLNQHEQRAEKQRKSTRHFSNRLPAEQATRGSVL